MTLPTTGNYRSEGITVNILCFVVTWIHRTKPQTKTQQNLSCMIEYWIFVSNQENSAGVLEEGEWGRIWRKSGEQGHWLVGELRAITRAEGCLDFFPYNLLGSVFCSVFPGQT